MKLKFDSFEFEGSIEELEIVLGLVIYDGGRFLDENQIPLTVYGQLLKLVNSITCKEVDIKLDEINEGYKSAEDFFNRLLEERKRL